MGRPQSCYIHRVVGMWKVEWICACGKDAKYGTEAWKPIYCGKCKPEGLRDVTQRICRAYGCGETATAGILQMKKPTVCDAHRPPTMVFMDGKCHVCRATGINKNYKPMCARCFFYINPTDPRCRNIKTKEGHFMAALKLDYEDMVVDKVIEGGCSNRRPDGLIDCTTHSIIVEIDEDKHSGYSCENKRIMQIFQDLGNRPLVCIRINPDGYVNKEGKRVVGAFKRTKAGGINVNGKILDQRIALLKQTVEEWVSHIPTREIQEIKLCYG